MSAPLRAKEAHLWEREEHDHYVEPAWCSERLFDALALPPLSIVLDPACGFGTIVEAACRAGHIGAGRDVVPRWLSVANHQGHGSYALLDFLSAEVAGDIKATAIVSNPPFKDAERFAKTALERSRSIVALLLPTKWIQGDKRSKWLATTPLSRVLCLCPRPSMPPGHVITAGEKPGNGTVDFAWFVWKLDHVGSAELGWLYRGAIR